MRWPAISSGCAARPGAHGPASVGERHEGEEAGHLAIVGSRPCAMRVNRIGLGGQVSAAQAVPLTC